MNKFKASLPHEEGLLVHPEVRKNLKWSRKKSMLLPLLHRGVARKFLMVGQDLELINTHTKHPHVYVRHQ